MKRIPFYKKRWFVGTKIQRGLIIYIIFLALFSRFYVLITECSLVEGPYSQYLIVSINVLYYGYLIYGYLLTNRIAGPLFRLKRHMDEVTEGKADIEIQFRKNDYGSDIAESFNAFVKKKISES